MPSTHSTAACPASTNTVCSQYTSGEPTNSVYDMGTMSAFTITGGMMPRIMRSTGRRTTRPMTNVSAAATSVAAEPKKMSMTLPDSMLPSIQPTHRPITASGKNSGSTVSASLGLNCTSAVENDVSENAMHRQA